MPRAQGKLSSPSGTRELDAPPYPVGCGGCGVRCGGWGVGGWGLSARAEGFLNPKPKAQTSEPLAGQTVVALGDARVGRAPPASLPL